jgi:hypothetical protein
MALTLSNGEQAEDGRVEGRSLDADDNFVRL